MKKDQYIPHDVTMRNNSQVINLIETEGAAGYGIYWAIMEYLRTQDDYIGDCRALRNIARQLKVRPYKILKILNDYGLFVCHDFTFYSPKLLEVMKPFEDKRARIEAYKQRKRVDNSLKTKDASDAISFDKVKGEVKGEGEVKVKEERKTTSSLKETKDDDGDVLNPVSSIPAWEQYVDDLQREQGWIEIMAMRSGMGKTFIRRFDEVLKHFKQHIRALARESHIVSPAEAKRYFCFYNTPGSATFMQLMEHLKQTEVPDPYRFEYRDPETGKRSYCDVPIPDEAPPRPNDQANWNPLKKKWVY